jgi:hypothetical protein
VGTLLGLLIVSSLVRGLTMARVPFEDQKIVLGAVLIVAAVAYQLVSARQGRRRPPSGRSPQENREAPTDQPPTSSQTPFVVPQGD